MGFRVSLYAIFDTDVEAVHRQLGLTRTGEAVEFPDSSIAGAIAPSGAYIVYVNDRDLFGEELIRPILRTCRMMACNVNETVMYSAAWSVANGREEWSVIHDANEGLLHLEAIGNVPACYSAIREAKLSAQAGEDEGVDRLFDVPVEVFVATGGVRYDEEMETEEKQPWRTLQTRRKPRRRWWTLGR